MKKTALISIAVMLFCCKLALAQEPKTTPTPKVTATNCEGNTLHLDVLSQYTARSDLIIIISHLGLTEKKVFGKRRLHNAETFFNKGAGDKFIRPLDFIATAEGKRVNGKGYLDFFVKGELALRIFVAKDRDLAVHYCVKEPEEKRCSEDFEKLIYPCKAKIKK